MTQQAGPSLVSIPSEECYHLLGSKQFGRLGLIIDNYPVIIPVNYAMDQGVIVVRSLPGSKLSDLDHANVTFEVDSVDEDGHNGWSVLVRGQAEKVTGSHSAYIVEHTEATGLLPWAPGENFRWVRIIPHGISGRRLSSADQEEWRLGVAAYL